MADRNPARVKNHVLTSLRAKQALSQAELAEALNKLSADKHDKPLTLSGRAVSRWESGESATAQPYYLRLLADFFAVTVDDLGFGRPLAADDGHAARDDLDLGFIEDSDLCSDVVSRDQRHWLDTRTALGKTRRRLALAAAELYPGYSMAGLENTGVITHPDWVPAEPIRLDAVHLILDAAAMDPEITGGEAETDHVRPLMDADRRFRHYHDALGDLARPRLFENRLCFRLTGVDWNSSTISLNFGHIGFFDSMDTNEALAHETAEHCLARKHNDGFNVTKPSWRRLPFRTLVGDPFNLARRPLMGAIGTLTIRGGESPSVVLHQRDGGRVAGGGGMTHLLPAGIFQPSSVLPSAVAADFSLWRNIQREFAEELLGHDEYDGTGRPIAYDELEPFVTLDHALADGRIKVWCLGVTLDALTLSGDILTVAVIDPEMYDDLFANAVASNSEGTVSARALPFEANTLQYLRDSESLSPGAAAALSLAWKHRHQLLGRSRS